MYLKASVAFIYVVTIYSVGYLLYVFSGVLRSLSFLLMLSFRSAKSEIRVVFRVYRSIGD